MEVTRTAARFVVGSRPADVPAAVRKEAARSLLNWVGCAIGACRHETVNRALAALAEFAGPAQATVLGRGERLDILNAALLNGTSSHVFDFDDTHLKTVIHPSGPVAAAILALAEHRPVSGVDFLHAFILGIEIECRIGHAVLPAHYDVGWHITGTAGVFGAAAAAGKLLGLSEQQMVWALGLAATQSAGLREMFGTMCKPFHPGRAAQNGLTAALLARRNFTSSNQGIEAKRGFAHVMSSEQHFERITEGLGERWAVAENTYKPFACGIVIHPAIDACVQLRNEHGLTADMVSGIELDVHPLVLELTGKKTPRTGLEGKFSVYHSSAVAIIHGAAGEREYSDECVTDPAVVALRDRVTATVAADVREDQVRARIRLADGRVLERSIEHVVGSLDRPMTDADLEAKFRGLAQDHLSDADVAALIAMLWEIERLPDAGAIAQACVPGAAKARPSA